MLQPSSTEKLSCRGGGRDTMSVVLRTNAGSVPSMTTSLLQEDTLSRASLSSSKLRSISTRAETIFAAVLLDILAVVPVALSLGATVNVRAAGIGRHA